VSYCPLGSLERRLAAEGRRLARAARLRNGPGAEREPVHLGRAAVVQDRGGRELLGRGEALSEARLEELETAQPPLKIVVGEQLLGRRRGGGAASR